MTDQPIPATATPDESWVTQRPGPQGPRPERIALILAIGFPLVLMIAGAIFLFAVYKQDRAQKAELAAKPAASAPVATDPAQLSKDTEIAQLRAELAAVQSRGLPYTTALPQPVYADQSAIAQISARLDRIEANQKHLALAAAAANAAANLEAASRKSGPFERELLVTERTLENPRLLDPIRAYADKGVASETLLAVQFPRLATNAAVAARSQTDRKDIVSGLLRLFAGIISIRHVADDGSQSPDALLARAQAKLELGDLEGAVAIINTLPPEARVSLKPWLDEANKRLAITNATRTVSEAALSRLAQGQDAATPTASVRGGAL